MVTVHSCMHKCIINWPSESVEKKILNKCKVEKFSVTVTLPVKNNSDFVSQPCINIFHTFECYFMLNAFKLNYYKTFPKKKIYCLRKMKLVEKRGRTYENIP